jgi:hypothetical protein
MPYLSCENTCMVSEWKYSCSMLPRNSPNQAWLPHTLTSTMPVRICSLGVPWKHKYLNTSWHIWWFRLVYSETGGWRILADVLVTLINVSSRFSNTHLQYTSIKQSILTNQIEKSVNVTKNSGVEKSYLTWAYLTLNVQHF